MRLTDTKEIDFNLRFALGQLGNSWYKTLAGRDHAKREAAARFICKSMLSKFRKPMFFGEDSLPIEQDNLEATIRAAILELGPLTYDAARSGHQETRRSAHGLVIEQVMERLGPIAILVADPSENIFSDMGKVGRRND